MWVPAWLCRSQPSSLSGPEGAIAVAPQSCASASIHNTHFCQHHMWIPHAELSPSLCRACFPTVSSLPLSSVGTSSSCARGCSLGIPSKGVCVCNVTWNPSSNCKKPLLSATLCLGTFWHYFSLMYPGAAKYCDKELVETKDISP